MSLSHALTNALSGLTANARAADIVAANLANLHTPGYGRREIELAPMTQGTIGGVRVVQVVRHMDQGVLSDRRAADAGLALADVGAGFFQRLQDVIGTPDMPGSISARIAGFEEALTVAASRPEAPERLAAVANSARQLAQSFAAAAQHVQAQRVSAEQQIAVAVEDLNAGLQQVATLNTQIQEAQLRGFDTSSLEDRRQVIIDRIAEQVPVREVPKAHGTVGLVTTGGMILLDRVPAEISFSPANTIVAEMTIESGALSPLLVNGAPAATDGAAAPMQGGRLEGLFAQRDEYAVTAQAELDALARNLVDRFDAPGLDPSLAAGAPGLFTDGGAKFDPADEVGLAERLRLNGLVDPDQGGAVWRLRDGTGASTPGAEGDASLLMAYGTALTQPLAMASGQLSTGAASLSEHAASLISGVGQARLSHDQTKSFAAVRQGELQNNLLMDGVDSDAETQRLLLIEQAYAANARLIETVEEMMQMLMRI